MNRFRSVTLEKFPAIGTWVASVAILALLMPLTGCFHERLTRGMPQSGSVSRPYPTVNFETVWNTTLNLLREYEKDNINGKRLSIYTRDTRGRFVVYVYTRRGIFRRHREKLDIGIFPGETQGALVVVETTPEVYEIALTAPPEWMPSRRAPNAMYAQRFIDDLTSRLAQTVSPTG